MINMGILNFQLLIGQNLIKKINSSNHNNSINKSWIRKKRKKVINNKLRIVLKSIPTLLVKTKLSNILHHRKIIMMKIV